MGTICCSQGAEYCANEGAATSDLTESTAGYAVKRTSYTCLCKFMPGY